MMKISLNYRIENNLHKVGCVSVSKLTFTGSENNGGSGRVRVLGPDPTSQGLDPTRPAVVVNIPDPTRPDPRVDPTREQLCAYAYLQIQAKITNSNVCRQHAFLLSFMHLSYPKQLPYPKPLCLYSVTRGSFSMLLRKGIAIDHKLFVVLSEVLNIQV